MFCPNCGKQISDGCKFCSYCGASLEEKANIISKAKSPSRSVSKIVILIVLIIVIPVVSLWWIQGYMNARWKHDLEEAMKFVARRQELVLKFAKHQLTPYQRAELEAMDRERDRFRKMLEPSLKGLKPK